MGIDLSITRDDQIIIGLEAMLGGWVSMAVCDRNSTNEL